MHGMHFITHKIGNPSVIPCLQIVKNHGELYVPGDVGSNKRDSKIESQQNSLSIPHILHRYPPGILVEVAETPGDLMPLARGKGSLCNPNPVQLPSQVIGIYMARAYDFLKTL